MPRYQRLFYILPITAFSAHLTAYALSVSDSLEPLKFALWSWLAVALCIVWFLEENPKR